MSIGPPGRYQPLGPGRAVPLPRIVVIGLGNELRGDDGAGPAVARRLAAVGGEAGPALRLTESSESPGRQRAAPIRRFAVRLLEGDGTELLDAWRGAELALVADALAPGGEPGTIRRFAAQAGPLPAGFARLSSHSLGLAGVVELARVLGELPPRLIVYGIVGLDFTAGSGLSPAVARAVEEAGRRILEEVRNFTSPGRSGPRVSGSGKGVAAASKSSATRRPDLDVK